MEKRLTKEEFLKDLWHPNTEEPDKSKSDIITLDIEEESFSSYVMTLDQSWYKLGNVYAGIGFLKEKE